MSANRSWMYRDIGKKSKHAQEYIRGVNEFIEFAFSHRECVADGMIRCPSNKCEFLNYESKETVQMCLLRYGFVPNYELWTRHGESHVESDDDIVDVEEEGNQTWAKEMITEAAGPDFQPFNENPNTNSKKFYDMYNAADEPLWKGCDTYSTLTAVSQLLHLKSEHGMTIRAFDEILSTIKRMLPKDEKLPDSFYRCKAMMKNLGLPYEKIHACENDCVLFRGENKSFDTCPICGESRYKKHENKSGEQRKPIPRKVVRYFPIIPRLQRLYLSSKTAKHMRWHSDKRKNVPGELRHPADGEAWKDFDRKYPDFAEEVRNIRLAMATDGFDPFGHFSKPHSTWPVFLVPYNLPPWMCMKEAYMFLSLVIPGPKGPGRELDVYLQPVIEELKILWDVGVETYDIFSRQNFNMRAVLMWTISDFPAYGMLSGWSTHGKMSCPCCMDKDVAFYLKEGRKPCYFGCHRRWLVPNHRWRSEKAKFNNKTERRLAPPRQTGYEVSNFVSQFDLITLGKGKGSDDKTPGFGVEHNWTKKSIFFELPYWSTLLLRHNLDVMHIEKNVFDNVFYTVMNVKGKTKDHLKARMDLQTLGIRPELHPIARNNGKWTLPKAKYALTTEQAKQVYEWLQLLKVPDGYAGNISRCVNPNECKVSGLKSHDCHVLMERFLPMAFREFLPKDVWEPLNSLSQFFRVICSKVYKEEALEKLEEGIVETLCRLEMIFPPSFFDSMEHLPIHLAYEAKVGGPVQYRWMYPFERCMHSLKKKVRNKACPEGSIAEAYWIEEVANFCSQYFDSSVQTKFNKPDRNNDHGGQPELKGRLSLFSLEGRPLGEGKQRWLSDEELNAATSYILFNCDNEEVYDLMSDHMDILEELHPQMSVEQLEHEHKMTFPIWFKEQVDKDDKIDARLKQLAYGPHRNVLSYDGFIVNGFRFHAKKLEPRRATQNSGVVVKGIHYGDNEQDYYGRLLEVIKLEYYGEGNNIFLFMCEWFDPNKGVEVDKYGFTKVNTKSRLKSYEPFVIASQVLQVFYANPVAKKSQAWATVITTKARNTYDVVEVEDVDGDTYQEEEAHVINLINLDDDGETHELQDTAHPGQEVEEEEDDDDISEDDIDEDEDMDMLDNDLDEEEDN